MAVLLTRVRRLRLWTCGRRVDFDGIRAWDGIIEGVLVLLRAGGCGVKCSSHYSKVSGARGLGLVSGHGFLCDFPHRESPALLWVTPSFVRLYLTD